MLWAESVGYCLNPECEADLFADSGTSRAEMAHIVPHSEGGPASFDNLLLLCLPCHREIDSNRTPETINLLRSWKAGRQQVSQARFGHRYPSFDALCSEVLPLLRRNQTLFDSYGPDPSDPAESSRQSLWETFEPELLANNSRLALLFATNKHLFHQENWQTILTYVDHAKEFSKTRTKGPSERRLLFPLELLEVFGLEHENKKLPPSVAALQNLIASLKDEGRFISLELEPNQILVYTEEKDVVELDLNNRAYCQQIFWNGRFFRPQTTKLRLETLVRFLKRIKRRKMSYSFDDYRDLTEVKISRKWNIKIYYEYTLGIEELRDVELRENLIAVNTHIWNNAPITDDAIEYAKCSGFEVMTHDQFFSFASMHFDELHR